MVTYKKQCLCTNLQVLVIHPTLGTFVNYASLYTGSNKHRMLGTNALLHTFVWVFNAAKVILLSLLSHGAQISHTYFSKSMILFSPPRQASFNWKLLLLLKMSLP